MSTIDHEDAAAEGASRPLLDVHFLSIETTRRCNLACEHCLRGKAQHADMPEELLDRFLSNVSHVGEVTFSGGEPSLALPIIRAFYRICEKRGIPVDSFFVATNGVANQIELAALLLERYAMIEDEESRSYCAVALSKDAYHEGSAIREGFGGQKDIVKGLAFYTKSKEHEDGDPDESWIIQVGNAYWNGLYGREGHVFSEKFSFESTPADPGITVDTVYLSTNGRIYSDANLPYDDMDAALQFPSDCTVESIEVSDDLCERMRARFRC